MKDETILAHISQLIEEEHQLRANPGAPDETGARLRDLEEQLDQCWDLLRQRRARREFGRDPDEAQERDRGTVERYEG